MQNLYSSCDEESNNKLIVISNWERPRFAVRSHYVRLMAGFGLHSAVIPRSITATTTTTTTTTTVLRPLYKTTCVSQHPQLKTGGSCLSKVLLPHAVADGVT